MLPRAAALAGALLLTLSAQPRWSPELALTVRSVGAVVPTRDSPFGFFGMLMAALFVLESAIMSPVWWPALKNYRNDRHRQLQIEPPVPYE